MESLMEKMIFPEPPTHYVIADGRIWDIASARFVVEAPKGAVTVELRTGGQPGDAASLRRTLEFYGLPVGLELMTLDEARKVRLKEINEACDAALNALTASYPEIERLTFDKQEAEARALLANPESPAPLLAPIASARGVDVVGLAMKVVAKADAFAATCGRVVGQRQKFEDQIMAAGTLEAVAAVAAEYSMSGAE